MSVNLVLTFSVCGFYFAERVKHKSDSATKLMNKANSAAAKVTTSNGNGALNRYESVLDFYPSKQGLTACTSLLIYKSRSKEFGTKE